MTTTLPALAGANMIFGMGMLESGVTFSLVQLVIDDMIVNDTNELIKSDRGLSLVSNPEWLRSLAEKGFPYRWWSPHRVRSRKYLDYKAISESRRNDIVDRARQTVDSILNTHRPVPLPNKVIRKIREILIETEERWKL